MKLLLDNYNSFTAAAGLLGFLICLIVLVKVYRKKKHHAKNIKSLETILNDRVSSLPRRYKYSEVKEMTKSFSCKLGQGGYGIVYKGTLRNGHRVAVKILNESIGNVEEFLNEVASISAMSHVNVVGLVGFCLQGSKRALVYDFMSNGSLERFIYADKHGSTALLDCEKLYDITMGIARGLEYLHRGCKNRIVHFDIKPHNILLDEDFCPKISDFGLAKLCHTKESIVSMTYPRGTPGYIAPEVFSKNFGHVTSKADVYSFGMMVLEMVGLRKDFDVAAETTSELYFYDWVFDCIDTNNEIGISCLNGKNKEIARRLMIVSLWCTQMTPSNRPSMSVVVDMLQESIEDLPMPPKP